MDSPNGHTNGDVMSLTRRKKNANAQTSDDKSAAHAKLRLPDRQTIRDRFRKKLERAIENEIDRRVAAAAVLIVEEVDAALDEPDIPVPAPAPSTCDGSCRVTASINDRY